MDEPKIESGIPIPLPNWRGGKRGSGRWVELIAKMNIGDSTVLPYKDAILFCQSTFTNHPKYKICLRRVISEDGKKTAFARCWLLLREKDDK